MLQGAGACQGPRVLHPIHRRRPGPMSVILIPLLQLLDVVLELYQIVLIVWSC